MFSNQAAELSVNRPVSAIDAVRGDRVHSRFVAGTSSVRASEDNHLLLLRFHSEANQIGIDGRLSHPTGPVGCLATSPSDPSLVLTTAENGEKGAATLWKIPPEVIDRAALGDDDDEDDGYDDEYDDDDDYYGSNRNGSNHSNSTDNNNSNNNVGDTDNDNDHVTEMGATATLASASRIVDLAWRGNAWDDEEEPSNPSSSSMGDVVTLSSDGTLTQWDVAFGSAESTRNGSAVLTNKKTNNLTPRMAWDPHHSDLVSVSTGDIVTLVDWREPPSSKTATATIGSATKHYPHHRYGITDLDYNPNKPNLLVTSGRDGLFKFWDLRNTGSGYYDVHGSGGIDEDDDDDDLSYGNKPKPRSQQQQQRPLLVGRGGHSHWTTRVCYNPFHDQLVLSAGTDSLVNLWRCSTISSAPLLTFDDEQQQQQQQQQQPYHELQQKQSSDSQHSQHTQQQLSMGPNVRVSRYEHLDSVNSIAWGAADAWIYMSASYDGKVVLNHVPSKEKYKILL